MSTTTAPATRTLQVAVVDTDATLTTATIEAGPHDLAGVRRLLGPAVVEARPLVGPLGMLGWYDEDDRFTGTNRPNVAASVILFGARGLFQPLTGKIVFTGSDLDGEPIDLTPFQLNGLARLMERVATYL